MTLLFYNGITKKFFNYRYFSKWSYKHQLGKPLIGITFGKLIEKAAEKYPERLAIISRHQKKSLTFPELLLQSDKLAAALKKMELQKGDCIGIWGTNSIEWEITSLASARLGLILVQLNPSYLAPEIEYCINKVHMKALICDKGIRHQNFYEILNQIGNLEKMEKDKLKFKTLKSIIMLTDETLSGIYNYNEIVHNVNENEVKTISDLQDSIQMDDPLNIQLTSGTTGHPKATLLTHHNAVNNSFILSERLELNKKHYKVCVQVPFFHTFGTTAGILASMHVGMTLVLPDGTYNPEKSLEAIAQDKCNLVYGTPTMYIDLINQQKIHKLDVEIEKGCVGAAPTSPQLIHDMINILKMKHVINFYGLTESTAMSFQSFLTDSSEKIINTIGHVLDNIEVKIVDENNKIVPWGTPGELCIRGYSNMLGYYNDVEKTKEILGDDGWIKTGDKVILYEDGYGKLIGRIKDMINRGGENVFPKEIEDFLSTHPKIIEGQVIGLPHERLGEEVAACIRLKPGTKLTLEELKEFCKGKMAYFKIPSKLFIMENFPKTTSGKIQKFKIVEQILENQKQ